MKIKIIIFLLSASAFARSGHDQGGGGSRIESAFRLSAVSIIEKVKSNKLANELCSAEEMIEGLEKSKIAVVDELIDTNTKKTINDTHLDAWTTPGLIQLKQKSWSQFLGDENQFAPSLAALILHEIYRTTESCNDDRGALSTAVVKALQNSTKERAKKFQKLMALTYVVKPPVLRGTDFGLTICEEDIQWQKPVKPGIHCMITYTDKSFRFPSTSVMLGRTTGQKEKPFAYLGANSLASEVLRKNHVYINQETPLYVLMYLNSGDIYYGMNLDSLLFFN